MLLCCRTSAECHYFLSDQKVLQPGIINMSKVGDFACLNPMDTKKMAKLGETITFGTLYPSSKSLVLKRAYLRRKWNQFYKEKQLFISGSKSVSIEVEKDVLEGLNLEELVRKKILDELDPNQHYKIEFKNLPPRLEIPGSDFRIEYDSSRLRQGFLKLKIYFKRNLAFRHSSYWSNTCA